MQLRRKRHNSTGARGVSRAAAEGASREDLIREALVWLARVGCADRFGVWLPDRGTGGAGKAQEAFQGAVLEMGAENIPREWEHLSPESPFPLGKLAGGKTVEQEFSGDSVDPLLGPAAGLRRALWVPVHRSGVLQGILLAGSRTARAEFPRTEMESLAAELLLVVELEREHDLARRRSVDAKLCGLALAQLAEDQAYRNLLQRIMESCMESAADGGPGAEFAAVGQFVTSGEGQILKFSWKSGKAEWLNALESEPLASFWRRALETDRSIGTEMNSGWVRRAVSRVIAIPLVIAGRTVGILAAGLAAADVSLDNLERLELRASCAAAALAGLQRQEESNRFSAEEQLLLDASERALVLVNESGQIVRFNRAAGEQFGEVLQAGAVQSLADCVHAKDRAAAEGWLRCLKAGSGEPLREAHESKLRNGWRVRMRHAGTTARGTFLISMEMDRAEENDGFRTSAELHALIEWLDQGVIAFDRQNRIRAINPRFAQLAGLAAQETSSLKEFEELVARLASRTDDPDIFARRWRELSHGGEAGIREEVHFAKPASRVLERMVKPVRDSSGKLLGRIELYRDLTGQRLLQSRLLHTEKLAALGQMISGVAHELSNPLTSIVGYAQRLLLRQDDLGRSEEVHRIFAEAERASAILRQMLLSARETPSERRPISLNQVIQRSVEIQKLGLGSEKIRVTLDLDPLIPPILGDAGQLQQVLMNLMGNARQAMEGQESEAVIRVRTARLDNGKRIRLIVSDTGPGIPEDILARIFDPFFTTKPAGSGTGLGLSIVLSIVREHGGKVYVSSPPGQGALFTIDLPASAKEQPVSATDQTAGQAMGKRTTTSSSPAVTAPLQPNKGTAVKVLVVEDEPTVAHLIADVLRDEGFEVDMVLNGRKAAQRALASAFSLVICDMKMPGFDGAQFYRTLTRTGSPLLSKFLFVTGDVLATQTREFLERNRIPYVAKPFRVEELLDKVHRVLGGNSLLGALSVEARKNATTKG